MGISNTWFSKIKFDILRLNKIVLLIQCILPTSYNITYKMFRILYNSSLFIFGRTLIMRGFQ